MARRTALVGGRATLGAAVVAGVVASSAHAEVNPRMFRPFAPHDAVRLKEAHDAAERGEWATAYRIVRRVPDGGGKNMVDWLRMTTEHAATFAEIVHWMNGHPNWPSSRVVQRIGEEAAPEGGRPEPILAFFRNREPITARGARIYAEALLKAGETTRARSVLRDGWVRLDMSRDESARYRGVHGQMLRGAHDARLDRLLWDRETSAARAMLPRVSNEARRLAEARLALQARSPGVDSRVNAVPRSLRGHPGLSYDRMRWRVAKERRASAEEMMLSQSDLGEPEHWADERRLFSREAFEDGNDARALALAGPHGLTSGVNFAELEWFAGWMALRQSRPEDAARRFRNLWENTRTPISRARAAYWLAEAHAAMGDAAKATEWRRNAAGFPTAYYGQLAASKLGRSPAGSLTRAAEAARSSRGQFDARLARVGMAFLAAGNDRQARRFFARAAKTTMDAAFIRGLADSLRRQRRLDMVVVVGKQAAANGVIVPEALYPIPNIPEIDCGPHPAPETALVLAVTRQESEFRLDAVSRSGAQGLMQLMPPTARRVANWLDIDHTPSRLRTDPHYNTRLGACYLAELLERFDNSYVLAAAAYNAGPSRAWEWVSRFGDPRLGRVDTVDWVESIPYNETRNYVQRVMENVHVYRERLGMRVAREQR